MIRFTQVVILYLCFGVIGLNGQKLDHVLGEIVIQLEKGENANFINNRYNTFNGRNTDISISQVASIPLNVWKIKFNPNSVSEIEVLESLRSERRVTHCQQNFILSYRAIPDDPSFNLQWQYINDGSSGGVEDIDTDIEIAWDITTGGLTPMGDTIVVCIIDDGMDEDHMDFDDNLWVNYAEIPDNGIDDDNNGYIDDYRGWDSIEEDDNIFRQGGHGISVTGIVGAQGNNGLGVAGVNWDVKLMLLRGGTTFSNAVASLSYPYMMRKKYNDTNGAEGAYVVATNGSWGFDGRFALEAPIWCAFYDSLGQEGIINVAATTNSNDNVEIEGDLPTTCTSPFLIGVTNLQRNGTKRSGAGYGTTSIDLAAPGESTYTTFQVNRYANFSGTSGTSPHVAGAIGLLYSTPCSVLSELSKSDPYGAAMMARDLVLGTTEFNPNLINFTATQGHLNIGNAVTAANNLCDQCPYPTLTDAEATGSNIIISWDQDGGNKTDIRYRLIGTENWNEMNEVVSPLTIGGIGTCMMYEIQLRSNCSQPGEYSYSNRIVSDNCCSIPNILSLAQEGDNVMVNWDVINAAIEYDIEFKKLPDPNWISAITTTNSFMIEGVTSCEGLEFRIRSLCSDEVTAFSAQKSISINCQACQSLPYCSIISLDNDFEFINSVSVNGSKFISGANLSGYGDFIGNLNWVLTQDSSYEIEIEPGFDGGSFDENMVALVDWDQDGNFDTSEIVFAPEVSSSLVAGNITVPSTALPGVTRMRVILSFDPFVSACPNDNLEFGEIEDYCVTVQSNAMCSTQPKLESFNTTSTQINLIWTRLEGLESYTLRYRQVGQSTWIESTESSSDIIIRNLSSCTGYEIQANGICGSGESGFSEISTINTRCGTAVNDPNGLVNSYAIYPKLFHNEIKIDLDSKNTTDDYKVSIIDINGKVIHSINTKLGLSGTIISNLDVLPSGLYIILIDNGDFRITDKVVKM